MLGDVRMSLSENFLFRQNALFTIYPPGGFISWHNNANASAFNLIFTWSETGEGDFTYLDRNRNKLVTIKDEPGWQAKGGFFASYRENPRHLVYHSAKTDCWRITIAFILDRSEFSRQMQEEIIQAYNDYQLHHIVADPATDGIVNLSLTNLQTDLLNTKKRYVYDVEVSYVSESDGLGNLTYIIERILEGTLKVNPSVTKA